MRWKSKWSFLTAPEQSRRNGWPVKSIALALGVVGLVGAASSITGSSPAAGLQGLMSKEQRIQIVPSYPACSAAKENCMDTGCCQVSGHKCFITSPTKALCAPKCEVGKHGFKKCEQPPSASFSVPVEEESETDLYCFSLYTQDTGSSKKSYELELLQKQKKYGVSIFACESWDVFSDVSTAIGDDYTTVQVFDNQKDWHHLKRKTSGTWVNWGIFYSIWEKIKQDGRGQSAWWTVKADADAVFLPDRLRLYIKAHNLKDTPHGLYFENCKNVQYGYFGNLEVISRKGYKSIMNGLEECHASFAPCADTGCDWKYGAWGEDVWIQRCMDHHYVDKYEAFDLTRDGACASDRPKDQKKNKKWKSPDCSAETAVSIHPFKKPDEYFKCMGEATGRTFDA